MDLAVCLLDYRSPTLPQPDASPLIDTHALGWQGLHDVFTKAANDSWREALAVYRATGLLMLFLILWQLIGPRVGALI